ncbi:hypothetical protein BFP97_17890 [Roseivirga sp. 4D4]|uniref:hypothetical protein n=1 Tax=Roseivirga sp. 4D4 TaxID=1889784 RepID=UPI000853D109|nr:hypothetical protein [Roseivirga sp. 4D4]OEK03282.1 hypothetical protein BFP97_17890 [Roseivirga sp. 4D4]
MEDFDEEAEQTKDIPYLDGFNIGYQLEKKTEDKSLSKEDQNLISSMTNLLKKSRSDSDKIQGMLDGRKQRIKDQAREQNHSNKKQRDQDRER